MLDVCVCFQSEWFILGLTSSTITILQYTSVTGPNQSGSSPPGFAPPGGTVSGHSTGIPIVL